MNLIAIHQASESNMGEKEQHFEFQYVDRFSQQKNEALNRVNPMGTVPTIVDASGNLVLGES